MRRARRAVTLGAMTGRIPKSSAARAGLLAHTLAMLEDVPVGLLLLDADLQPLWFNAEAARACAVWNHGERRAAALRARREFVVPAPLLESCRALLAESRLNSAHPHVVSDHARGLHARVRLHTPGAGRPPAFHVHLDYRRPRGDRHRSLSPGALALLARLTEREREVAMRVREGLRTSEIAGELRRSPLTIKTQLAAVFSKLNIRGRTRVAALLNR
ncbi:MAG: Bacterial regulatory protein luxR family [Verrucomicrobia bacterium]|nr:Bacterial regulatory protein luxR family [Verrucomicrobiota bacterium]